MNLRRYKGTLDCVSSLSNSRVETCLLTRIKYYRETAVGSIYAQSCDEVRTRKTDMRIASQGRLTSSSVPLHRQKRFQSPSRENHGQSDLWDRFHESQNWRFGCPCSIRKFAGFRIHGTFLTMIDADPELWATKAAANLHPYNSKVYEWPEYK